MRLHYVLTAALCCAVVRLSSSALAPQDLVAQARRLDAQGKADAAVAMYQQALEQDPGSFDAHYGIARVLDLLDRYEEARPHFAKAIELASDSLADQALRMMGISYVFTGETNEAARYFEQVFERRVSTGNVVAATEVANELGRVYLESGDVERAREWYRKGYETAGREKGRPAASVDLAALRWAHAQGRIAARRGDRREADRQTVVVKRLLDKGTNEDQRTQYFYLLGYVQFYRGAYAAAIEHFQHADQDDPFILVLLAQSYGKLGEIGRAGDYYRKVLASTSHAVSNAFARRIAREQLPLAR